MKFLNEIYLDNEKDIIVKLYQSSEDELTYILETPNHGTGNLITNLAKICGLETIKNKQDMKIIKGTIPLSINGDFEEVYIFRLGGVKIANIYPNGKIEIKAEIPSIMKTLMSQTKDYKFGTDKTIIKSYLLKKEKFRTDLHTHMNANLTPDLLIALGISRQIKYPLYYIKKLDLKITKAQEKEIMKQRKEVEKQFENSTLMGKYLTRRIDDNTFINFADFILNNLKNAKENIEKIRKSLAIMKDGQAVFTNLEKVYLYRYVFAKGIDSEEKIKLDLEKIEQIPQKDIKDAVIKMLEDKKVGSPYRKNTLRQDKLLWVARQYQKQGIYYTEISDTTLTKKGEPAIELLEEVHEIMPKIEKETGVKIRFLVAIRRIALTIIKDKIQGSGYLREALSVLKAVSKSPYVVGCDFVGEEINDISELQPVIEEIVQYIEKEDKNYTIRVHAGENDSLINNVYNSIECVKNSLKEGQKMPKIRIGHGLYTPELSTKEGRKLIKQIKDSGTVLEFQLTSNVRLNNLSKIENHPLKKYLDEGVKCVQGTDGCGLYGSDTIDEQLALKNLLGLDSQYFEKMKAVENEIIKNSDKYFENKSKKFEKFLNGRTIRKAVLEEEYKIIDKDLKKNIKLRLTEKINSEQELKDKIKELPVDKIPIIVAGGSFNGQNNQTIAYDEEAEILRKLVENIDEEKAFFVIGHKIEGYEKKVLDLCKKINPKIEVYAIIPNMIEKDVRDRILKENLAGIRISTESEDFGIYKSFNYEIFERRPSIVIALDGNSPVLNLIQEAKNGKAKAKIYLNKLNKSLRSKARTLQGYVTLFEIQDEIWKTILEENEEIKKSILL
ncbi:MAG: adenosine deaminase [Clostridia bacterium]|nr:adenosine deaminase [Clostridia bacterium]